jgi:chaperonin cofactor prefoldin
MNAKEVMSGSNVTGLKRKVDAIESEIKTLEDTHMRLVQKMHKISEEMNIRGCSYG